MLAEDLTTNAAEITAAFDAFDDAQRHFKPAPDRWSVAECFEHVAVVETGIVKLLLKYATTEPSEERYGPERVANFLRDSTPRVAPEFVLPQARPLPALRTNFVEGRQRLAEALAAEQLVPHGTVPRPHPLLGALSVREWLHFLIAHAERHRHQMEALRAYPDFPR